MGKKKNEDFRQNSSVGGCDYCAKSGGGRLTYDVIKLNFLMVSHHLVCILCHPQEFCYAMDKSDIRRY